MKKPASLKRPAASINDAISKMHRGVSNSELDPPVEGKSPDSDEAGEAGRDKSKGQKYAKMKHELPDHVVDLVEKESLKSSSPRDFKTMVINRLYKRNEAGKLVLNLEDELFSEHKKVYARKYSKEKDVALPESIMRGLYFGNCQKTMDQAKADGDIIPVDCGNGKQFWSFTSFTKGTESGRLEEQDLSQKKKVSKDQAKMLSQAFQEIGWSWKYGEKDVKAIADGKKIPQPILQLVNQANDSQQKLAKEAMTLIKGWHGNSGDDRLVKLKKGHAVCQQNLAKLSHMKEFQELPDDLEATKANLDKIMQDMAVFTKDYNILVETSRGALRALRN